MTDYFEMKLAEKADRLQLRCNELEAALREIRVAVTAPKTNELAIGIVHEITARALVLKRVTHEV
jgi:hypothetical protein